jgi:hypothetical protein
VDHSLSPFQKLFDFLEEPYGKGKSMSRFFQGNEAYGIIYDAMSFAPHLIENVDIVEKYFTQGNFGKLDGRLVLSFSRGRFSKGQLAMACVYFFFSPLTFQPFHSLCRQPVPLE